MNRLTDEQLMERMQQGQTSALDELYRRYAGKLYVFCYNATRSKNPQEAEDLAQDVFVRVIKSAHTFDPQKASVRTWMFSIARNRCIDAGRRSAIIKFLPIMKRTEQSDAAEEFVPEDALVDPREDVERAVMRNSDMEAVSECIAELDNEDERQALLLYYLGGKVYREIGEVLNKSTSMARNRVKAAQEKVKRCLERKGVAPHA